MILKILDCVFTNIFWPVYILYATLLETEMRLANHA